MDLDAPHFLVLQGAGTPAEIDVPDVVDQVPAGATPPPPGNGSSNPAPEASGRASW